MLIFISITFVITSVLGVDYVSLHTDVNTALELIFHIPMLLNITMILFYSVIFFLVVYLYQNFRNNYYVSRVGNNNFELTKKAEEKNILR